MQEYGVNHWVLSQREYHEDVAWCGDFDIIVDPFLRISHLHGLPCTITRAPCDTLYLVSVIGAGNIRFLARFTSSGARSPTRSPSTPGVGDPLARRSPFLALTLLCHALFCSLLLRRTCPHTGDFSFFFFSFLSPCTAFTPRDSVLTRRILALRFRALGRTVIVYSYDGTDVTSHSFVSFESTIWSDLYS